MLTLITVFFGVMAVTLSAVIGTMPLYIFAELPKIAQVMLIVVMLLMLIIHITIACVRLKGLDDYDKYFLFTAIIWLFFLVVLLVKIGSDYQFIP